MCMCVFLRSWVGTVNIFSERCFLNTVRVYDIVSPVFRCATGRNASFMAWLGNLTTGTLLKTLINQ